MNAEPQTSPSAPSDRLELAEASVPGLVEIWLAELDRFVDLAQALNDEQWRAASPCPGWTVGDVVAHVAALESELRQDPLPQHVPDWDSLPHVSGDLDRHIEMPVDFRRGKRREEVVAELRELVAARHVDLTPAPTDPDEIVPMFAGLQVPRKRSVQMRILDVWVHGQDVRDGAGLPGGLDSAGAWVTAGRFAAGLPFVWGKVVGAPVGSTLQVNVDGPGVAFTRTVVVGTDGRARIADRVVSPDVLLSCPWPTFAHLCAGRLVATEAPATDKADGTPVDGGATTKGDAKLGRSLLPALRMTP